MASGKKHSGQRGPSQRQLMVGETMRQALSDMLLREDIYIPGTNETLRITVSEVRISPDMHNATVFVMPLAGKDKNTCMKALDDLAPQLRSMLARRVSLRVVPRLTFRMDESFENAATVNMLLNQSNVRRDTIPETEE